METRPHSEGGTAAPAPPAAATFEPASRRKPAPAPAVRPRPERAERKGVLRRLVFGPIGGLFLGIVTHPWMTLAAILSVAVPMTVALLPTDGKGRTQVDAALDSLPIPGTIEIHNATAMPAAEFASDPSAPRPLQPGWDVPPAAISASARYAEFRDDVDASHSVQTVGSNRPALARPRGAWLTGTIEDAPAVEAARH